MRAAARALVCTTLVVLAAAAASHGATSGSVVGADVPGATSLDLDGCPSLDATRMSLGALTPGVSAVTAADCDIVFGSSNATATLRAYRASPRASAMAGPPSAVVEASPTGRVLDLDMADATTGWSSGDGNAANRIRRTTDGGVTWNSIASPIGGSARAISSPSPSIAWVARTSSNVIVRTSDGGVGWTTVTLPDPTARTVALHALDDQVAWAAGTVNDGADRARIWHTTDGGATWSAQLTEADTAATVIDVVFEPGAGRGWATTAVGEIFSTGDGVTWSLQSTSGSSLQAIDAISATHALVVGSHGQVRRTTDGGITWTSRDRPEGIMLRDVAYRPSGVAWAVGDLGLVYRSTDHGNTWSVVPSRRESSVLQGVEAMSDASIVIGTSADAYVRTVDAGATWTRSTTATPGSNWRAVHGVDGGAAWRVGSAGSIERSLDGGASWTAQASGTSEALHDVAAIDRQRALAVGTNGTIVHTSDGGATWSPIASGTTATLRAAEVTPGGHVWVGGDGGVLLRSANAGASFAPVASGTTDMVHSIGAFDQDDVFVGTGTQVRRTTDAGASWSVVAPPPMSGPALAIDPVPDTDVLWASFGQFTARSPDRGATWTSNRDAGSGQLVQDLDAVDETHAWIVGRYGIVRRTTDGGTTFQPIPGTAGTRAGTGVLSMGPDDAIVAGDAGSTITVSSSSAVADYGEAGATWSGGTGHFGACLRQAPGTTTIWPTTGSCPTSDGTNWRGLAPHGGDAGAAVAATTAPGLATASLRFGMKVGASVPTGTYRAPITFEVLSPS